MKLLPLLDRIKGFFLRLLKKLPDLISGALDFVYPPVCLVCGLYCEKDICPDCIKLVTRPDKKSFNIRELYAYGDFRYYAGYSGVVKEIIGRFKFKGEMWIGRRLGNILYESFVDCFDYYDLIVYVPAGRASFLKRGFDQCSEIAAGLSKRSGLPVLRALESNSGKGRQHRLKRDSRKDNVTGRFRISDVLTKEELGKLCGSRTLLIDDILTTGSTLRECACLLIDECGCLKVDAMVFATGRTDIG